MVAVPKNKTKKKILFYNLTEYNLWLPKNDIKSYDIKYKRDWQHLSMMNIKIL
jgi:hypothetical protein